MTTLNLNRPWRRAMTTAWTPAAMPRAWAPDLYGTMHDEPPTSINTAALEFEESAFAEDRPPPATLWEKIRQWWQR